MKDLSAMNQLWVNIVSKGVDILEAFGFYPKLKKSFEEIFKDNHKPLAIFDVGAHKGESIKFFHNLFPGRTKIHSFEPSRERFGILKQKYGEHRSIELNNVGVGEHSAKETFNENILSSTSTFNEIDSEAEYSKFKGRVLGVKPEKLIKESYQVDIISLDNYIEAKKIKKIDILKIDTEGYELKCLKGCEKSLKSGIIDIIQLEHHFDDMYKNHASLDELTDFLSKCNFKPIDKIPHPFGNFSDVLYRHYPTHLN